MSLDIADLVQSAVILLYKVKYGKKVKTFPLTLETAFSDIVMTTNDDHVAPPE